MTTDSWRKYHRDWSKRNPECIKRYRQRCARHKSNSKEQSEHYRLTEYWQLRTKFIAANPDHPAVIFPLVSFLLIK